MEQNPTPVSQCFITTLGLDATAVYHNKQQNEGSEKDHNDETDASGALAQTHAFIEHATSTWAVIMPHFASTG